MSESIIEQVARAIATANRAETNEFCPTWDDSSQGVRDWYSVLARAAIAEMREPTKEMLSLGSGYRIDDDDFVYIVSDEITTNIWQTMIDAALEDTITPAEERNRCST